MEKEMNGNGNQPKFKLFAGMIYYPGRGYEDFKGYFDSAEKAKEYVEKNEYEYDCYCWAQIVLEDKIIMSGSKEGYNPDEWEWEVLNE